MEFYGDDDYEYILESSAFVNDFLYTEEEFLSMNENHYDKWNDYEEIQKEKMRYFEEKRIREEEMNKYDQLITKDFLEKKIKECNQQIYEIFEEMKKTNDDEKYNEKYNEFMKKYATIICKKFKYTSDNFKKIKYNYYVDQIKMESLYLYIHLKSKYNQGYCEYKKYGDSNSGYSIQKNYFIEDTDEEIIEELCKELVDKIF